MTRYARPSCSPRSSTRAMLGWSSRAAARASRRSRSAARPSPAGAAPSTLTATGRSSSRSRAAHTSPIPPAPSSAPTRYRPPRRRVSTAPGASAITGPGTAGSRRARPRSGRSRQGARLPRARARPGPRARAVARVLLVLQRVHLRQELAGAGPLGLGLRAGDVVQDVQGVLDLFLGLVGHVLAAPLAGAAPGRQVGLGDAEAQAGPVDRAVGQAVADALADLADRPQGRPRPGLPGRRRQGPDHDPRRGPGGPPRAQ